MSEYERISTAATEPEETDWLALWLGDEVDWSDIPAEEQAAIRTVLHLQ